LASLIILDGKVLIRLWVGNSFESSYKLVVILTIGYVVSFAQYPSQLIAFATAKHKPLALMTLGEGSLNLLLSIVWARKYGLVGVALGTTVPLLLSKILYQPWYALRIAKVSFGEYAKESLVRPIAVCGLFWIICQFPLLSDFGSSFFGLLLTVCVQSVIYGLLAYLIGLGGNEKRMLFQHGRRLAAAIQFARAQ
jgi:O-antigen/teichoic acid export membrane protein